jgi:hypothetical protein
MLTLIIACVVVGFGITATARPFAGNGGECAAALGLDL